MVQRACGFLLCVRADRVWDHTTMPRAGSSVLRESFSPGNPEPASGQPTPPARRSAHGKRGAGARHEKQPPFPRIASDGAGALVLNESASVTLRVALDIDAGPATRTRARSRSVDEIQHFLFTWDGLRQLLATFVTLLPVLAVAAIIGMATFYGFGSQCDCKFSQASVARAEYENLTTMFRFGADKWDCCQSCWSQPYKHTLEEEWAPTCGEPHRFRDHLFIQFVHRKWQSAAQMQYTPALG